MTDEDWNTGFASCLITSEYSRVTLGCLGVRLAGDLIGDENESGEPIVGETLLLLFNAHHEPIPFTLPATKVEHRWERVFDTAGPIGAVPTMGAGSSIHCRGGHWRSCTSGQRKKPGRPSRKRRWKPLAKRVRG